MTLKYTEYDGVTEHTMETEAGTVGGTKRNVHGLAPAIVTQFTSMITHLASVAGTVSTGRLLVTIQSAVETKLDSIITALGSHLATLAGTVDSARLKVTVDAVLLALVAPTGTTIGQASSTTTSATFASQSCTLGFWAKNISTGTQKIYIFSGGAATTSNGYELAVGEERWFPCAGGNMSTFRHIASAVSANICFEAI
jgi:hypothetical protein